MPNDRLSNPNTLPIETLSGFWNTATSSIPAYLPGEMALIRAEANAMMGNITGAIAEIDAIRTKTPDRDPLGIGASLPPYSGAPSVEAVPYVIFRQRRAVLFLNGTG
ncbi:MAG: RagB/SusD family nutrient uptake outer membrane protein, partial [Gemmatimonadetes bacterium]|nr:RagB/SusD family nutrient uptake outer membrane protein [Gemmatimonadota bacterium]